jgi:hypothetical protein
MICDPNDSRSGNRRVRVAFRRAHVRRQVFPLKEFIQLELRQDLIPKVHAADSTLGECLLGAMSQDGERIFG